VDDAKLLLLLLLLLLEFLQFCNGVNGAVTGGGNDGIDR
jgi:hypothetical protein